VRDQGTRRWPQHLQERNVEEQRPPRARHALCSGARSNSSARSSPLLSRQSSARRLGVFFSSASHPPPSQWQAAQELSPPWLQGSAQGAQGHRRPRQMPLPRCAGPAPMRTTLSCCLLSVCFFFETVTGGGSGTSRPPFWRTERPGLPPAAGGEHGEEGRRPAPWGRRRSGWAAAHSCAGQWPSCGACPRLGFAARGRCGPSPSVLQGRIYFRPK